MQHPNSYFKHPNEEALVRVIVGTDSPTLCFNYYTAANRHWDSINLKQKYGYRVNYPHQKGQRVTVSL